MRKGLLWVLGVWFLSVGQLLAQSAATNPQEPKVATAPMKSETAKASSDSKKPADTSSASGKTTVEATIEITPANRGWARVEYLLWWVKDTPLPVPLVTTGDPRVGFDPTLVNTVNTAGALGQPGTRTLLGAHGINSRYYSGIRLTLGAWADESQVLGIEGSGFALEHRFNEFILASDRTGNPPFYFPIFSETAGGERGIPIADPLRGFSGIVAVTSTLRLWGAECNGVLTLYRDPWLDFTLLAGFRYADLRENLQVYNTTTDLVFNNVTSLNDSFTTRNQFYGGQIGSRLVLQHERCFLDLAGKVGLGPMNQVIDTQGKITQGNSNPLIPPGPGTFPGGIFTQRSNLGQRTDNQFTVLSSLDLKLGYELKHLTRVFVGYDLLYWRQVVRPGDQVNHRVNLSQNAVLDPAGVGRLVGPAQPAPLFTRSDFWAQGVNLGLEFRY